MSNSNGTNETKTCIVCNNSESAADLRIHGHERFATTALMELRILEKRLSQKQDTEITQTKCFLVSDNNQMEADNITELKDADVVVLGRGKVKGLVDPFLSRKQGNHIYYHNELARFMYSRKVIYS